MAKVKPKTLADYIKSGRHEFVASVRNVGSLSDSSRSNWGTWGNDLGVILFGVLVCDKTEAGPKIEREPLARIIYKEPPIYKGDSDIMFHDMHYSAKVISEVPLGIEVCHFCQGSHFKAASKEFEIARKLLRRHGLY
jgi:hypothetical protein